MKKILCVVPARAGSKGVKNKNIQKVGSKSLIERTLDCAVNSNIDMDICFTSDSDAYLNEVKELFPEVSLVKRDNNLSDDSALTVDVVRHSLGIMENHGGIYDLVLLLQVTTPFRTPTHVNEAVQYLLSNDFDSLVSVISVGGHHPFRMKRLENKFLVNFIDQGFEDMRPRQQLPPVYLRNGAIYITKVNFLKQSKSLVSGKVGCYRMDDISSLNIDTEIDIEFARYLAEKNAL